MFTGFGEKGVSAESMASARPSNRLNDRTWVSNTVASADTWTYRLDRERSRSAK
jgi:hypothetical protein